MKSSILFLFALVVGPWAHSSQINFPTKISCTFENGKGANNRETDLLYTRLDKVTDTHSIPSKARGDLIVWSSENPLLQDEPRVDEIARGWKGQYYGSYINRQTYTYSLTTCDMEDRIYTFNTKDLQMSSAEGVKHLTGSVEISGRGVQTQRNTPWIATLMPYLGNSF